jgi:hypothetical protein
MQETARPFDKPIDLLGASILSRRLRVPGRVEGQAIYQILPNRVTLVARVVTNAPEVSQQQRRFGTGAKTRARRPDQPAFF